MFRVLVVDDEIGAREAIRGAVDWEALGFELCGESADGELAFGMLAKLRPELLITDIRMPCMDGMQLCRRVSLEFPETRIMVVSACTDTQLLREAMALGVRAFLTKPVDARLLSGMLMRIGNELREEAARRERETALHACLDDAGGFIRERLLGELCGREDVEVIRRRARALGINLTARCYQLLLLRPLGTAPSIQTLGAALEKFVSASGDTVLLCRQGELFIILLLGDSPEHCLGRAQKLVQAARDVALRAGARLHIVPGAALTQLNDVPASLADAARELNTMEAGLPADTAVRRADAEGISVPREALSLPPLIEELRAASPAEVHEILERRAQTLGARDSLMMAHYLCADALLTAARISRDNSVLSGRNDNAPTLRPDAEAATGPGLTPLYPPCQGGQGRGPCDRELNNGSSEIGQSSELYDGRPGSKLHPKAPPSGEVPRQGQKDSLTFSSFLVNVSCDKELIITTAPSQKPPIPSPYRETTLAGGAGGVDPEARDVVYHSDETANPKGQTPLYPPCQGGQGSVPCEGEQTTDDSYQIPSLTAPYPIHPSQPLTTIPPSQGGQGGLTSARSEFERLMAQSELMLTRALESRDAGAPRRNAAVIRRARAYIDERFADPQLTMRDVANHVALSSNHFCTVFSRAMGVTYSEYLTGLRIRRAQELLRTTELRSGEIAYAVGYNDPHYFSNIFKKTTGISPRDYRRENRVKNIGK